MSTEKDKNQYSAKNVKSMKVAIFCIAALVILYLGCNFLQGLNTFGKRSYYYAVFDNIGGLHKSTTVAINGYPVGEVHNLTLMSTNPTKICAEILITEDIDIPIDSKFEVAQADLLGGMVLNIIVGQSKTLAQNKDTLACGLAPGMFDGIDELKAQLANVLASVDTIGMSVKSAFLLNDPENGAMMLKNTLVNLESSTNHLNQILAANGDKIGNVVTKLDQLSTTLSDATPQINNIIQNMDNISDSLAQSRIHALLNDAQSTIANLNEVTAKIERGEGSAGLLLSNDSLYNNINSTVESLNILLQDLKAHPSKYINVTVFGKKKQ